MPGKYGSLSAGLIASTLIGTVYFTPLAVFVHKVRASGQKAFLIVIFVVAAASIAVVAAIALGSQVALTVATPLFVLALVAGTAMMSARALARIYARREGYLKDAGAFRVISSSRALQGTLSA